MPLEKIDRSKTMRFEDGAAWLELGTRISKGDQDRIQDLNSRYRLSTAIFGIGGDDGGDSVEVVTNAKEINRTLFDILARAWSFADGRPTAADYDELTQASGEWVDRCISEAIASVNGGAEGNSRSSGTSERSSSKRRGRSPTTSPAASPST